MARGEGRGRIRHRPQTSGERAPRPAVLPLVEVAGDDERAVGGERAENGADVPGALVGVEAEVDADDVDSRVRPAATPTRARSRARVAAVAPAAARGGPCRRRRAARSGSSSRHCRGAPRTTSSRTAARTPPPGARRTGAGAPPAGTARRGRWHGRRPRPRRRRPSGRARCTTRCAASPSTSAPALVPRATPGRGRPRRSGRRRCPARRRRCAPRAGSRGRSAGARRWPAPGSRSSSPAAQTPPPMTNVPGSKAAARLAMPTPSQCPISPSSSRAVWSPSCAASVIRGPVRLPGRPSTRSSRSLAIGSWRRPATGPRGPGRCRWRTAPSSPGCRTRSGARPGRPACGRTPPRCRSGRAGPVRRRGCRRRCRCPASRIITWVSPRAGAEPPLGPRGGVGVVVDDDRHRHPLLQRLAAAARRATTGAGRRAPWRGRRPRSRRRRSPPRPPGRPRRGPAARRRRRRWCPRPPSGLLDRCGVSRRARCGDPAVRLHQPAGDLGAADVDADGQASAHALNPWPPSPSPSSRFPRRRAPRRRSCPRRCRGWPARTPPRAAAATGQLPAERGPGRLEQQVPGIRRHRRR